MKHTVEILGQKIAMSNDKVYKVSSTAKVQQMEAELSVQLAALRAEIEQSGVSLSGAPSKSFSSVPVPKDVSFFRMEREQALRRGLQVAEALPLVSQAQVVRRDLDSCTGLEYTPESLPPLLHQFFADRTYQLAQMKYLLMLRWRRFCRHSHVIEKLWPFYKDQVSFLVQEFGDAAQRARRLAPSREKLLTGRGNPVTLVTQDDVVIYLRWLVCHLHSLKTIHNFLRVLHYLPACDRKDENTRMTREGGTSFCSTSGEAPITTQDSAGTSGVANTVPVHTVKLEEFHAELQSLVSYFKLPCDVLNIRTSADEMEIFSMVSREFRSIFRRQEEMKSFLQYDGTEATETQWGRKDARMSLRKEANWIRFIELKPKRDPWQQKIVTKLKELKSVDELLRMHSRFLQVSDVQRLTEAMKEHAAHASDPQATQAPSVTPDPSRGQHVSQIWTSIYNAAHLFQESSGSDGGLCERRDQSRAKSRASASKTGNESYSYMDSMQRLGLDGGQEGSADPSVASGAHLSLLYLRHLKTRELQRVCLGLLNYLRSVEKTLTLDTAGLRADAGDLSRGAEETVWMNAARGGRGTPGGMGSNQYSHNTPVDYKVHCSEFMEFPEVENLHDFYSSEGRFVHTQDQRGLYVVYDAALRDLEELEDLLVLVGSHYIQRSGHCGPGVKGGVRSEGSCSSAADVRSLGRTDVDRAAVLLDLWTCEAEFLESKVLLLNCYFEAYQHVTGAEERFALAQVITDITHRRPLLDLGSRYFVQAYRAETVCLQAHQQLIRTVLDCQIDEQRLYLQRVWREGQRGSVHEYGLPQNYVPKHLVSLGGGSPALMSVFLLEVHPSLCLASEVYQGVARAHAQLCQLRRSTGAAENVALEQRVLQRALENWHSLAPPGASYSAQTQRDLFSDTFFEDPSLVRDVGVSLIRVTEETDIRQGKEKQVFAVETFSKLLELVTLRHRLVESAAETGHLAELYKRLALELGFDQFHLYLRPVQFEFAVQKDKAEQRPLFVTALLQDSSCVDRYTPSSLPLAVQELDENQIGKFSFSSEEAVIQLMNRSGVENLQVTLACQVTQKIALIGAVNQACVCYWAEAAAGSPRGSPSCLDDAQFSAMQGSTPGKDTDHLLHKADSSSTRGLRTTTQELTKERLAQAFVSIQLEKVGPRDVMLNSFMKKRQALGELKNPEEMVKIKRRLILDFCQTFSKRMSECCVRGQIIARYHSLTSLLDDLPDIRQSYFMIGQANEVKGRTDSELGLCPDPRTFQRRPRALLSADGRTLLNLWFIPHFTEVLLMFRTLDDSACSTALHHALQISSALHDIVCYLVGFARLGNPGDPSSWTNGRDTGPQLTADWGGTEGIGAELWELQRQVDGLCDPGGPEAVGRLLQLRRQVLFLQYDAAVRHLIGEAFLSSGDVASYQSVRDNMGHALPLLSDSISANQHSSLLPLPQPLDPHCHRAQRMFPWRSFLTCHSFQPLKIWDIPPIEYCMQLCLSGLSDRRRTEANGAILGVSLLMEDVLDSAGGGAAPLRLHDDEDADPGDGERAGAPPRGPAHILSVLKGFLLLTKQLDVFKESWGRRRLGAERIGTVKLHREFNRLYRAEIHYPSMRDLAQHMGEESSYEALLSDDQPLLPPAGASEVDVKTWQLRRLLESTECDMIRDVQRRIAKEMTLVMSERARQDTGFPTELWKRGPLKHSLAPERPQLVQNFTRQLMEQAEEQPDGQVRFSGAHLQQCLSSLGGSVMERERSSFLLYSRFYEQILQQGNQLLHQREQDVKNLEESERNPYYEVPALCRGVLLEVAALRARVAQLEEQNRSLEQQLSLRFRRRYDTLVRQMLCTCIQLKARLDEYHVRMDQDVSQLVSKVRREGADRITRLKRKYGSTTDDHALALTQAKQEQMGELRLENGRLTALLCQRKALEHWRQVVIQGKLHRELLQSQQREICCRTEALGVKMVSEEETVVLKEELEATKRALAQCQTEYGRAKRQLVKQSEDLRAARHRSAEEGRSRRELEGGRAAGLERLRAEVGVRDGRLRALEEQLDRGSRESRLLRQRSAKEVRQVRGQLHEERSLKQEAFQQVDRLQSQICDMGTTFSRSAASSGRSKMASCYTVSLSRSNVRNVSDGPPMARQQSAVPPCSPPQEGSETGPQQRGAPMFSLTQLDRPKTGPSRLRVLTSEALLPSLSDGESSSCLITQLQQLRTSQ